MQISANYSMYSCPKTINNSFKGGNILTPQKFIPVAALMASIGEVYHPELDSEYSEENNHNIKTSGVSNHDSEKVQRFIDQLI